MKIKNWKNTKLGEELRMGFKNSLQKSAYKSKTTSAFPKKKSLGSQLDGLTQIGLRKQALNPSQLEKMLLKGQEMMKSIVANWKSVKSETVKPHKQVSAKFFHPTSHVFVGHQDEPACKNEIGLLAKFLNRHGIKLIMPAGYGTDKNNITFGNEPTVSQWTQDFIEFHKTAIKTPYPIVGLSLKKLIKIDRIMTKGRYNLFNKNGDDFNCCGIVNAEKQQLTAIELANALGIDVEFQLSYAEGGNTLSWTHNNELFCIIGNDTLAFAKYLAAKHLGQLFEKTNPLFGYAKETTYNDKDVIDLAIKMLAVDYGTKVENLFFVEQPGKFHLDMRMAIAGHKKVIINDSVTAHNMMVDFFRNVSVSQLTEFEKAFIIRFLNKINKSKAEGRTPKIDNKFWNDVRTETTDDIDTKNKAQKSLDTELFDPDLNVFRVHLLNELERKLQFAKKTQKFELQAKADLEKKGFKVYRRPGSFHNPITGNDESSEEGGEDMNFFNMVTMTTPKKKKLIITLGTRDKIFDKALDNILNLIIKETERTVYKMGDQFRLESLDRFGGISCQMKPF